MGVKNFTPSQSKGVFSAPLDLTATHSAVPTGPQPEPGRIPRQYIIDSLGYRSDFVRFLGDHEITFRHYFIDHLILVKTDDHFARANGFNSIKEMQAFIPGSEQYEWINAKDLAEAFKYQLQNKPSIN